MSVKAYLDKTVLICGGALGIGRATVRAMAREGARVVFADIDEMNGSVLERELQEAGFDAVFIKCDSTQEKEVAALVDQVIARNGTLHVAINNVGNINPPDIPTARVHDTSLEAWRGTIERNLTSCYLGMKHEVLAMLGQGHGVIANTASLAGLRVTSRGSASYHAAKAGVVHLSRKAAIDYAGDGIRVNVVAPGPTATDRLLNRWPPDVLAKMYADIVPIGRVIAPEETAAAFLWVCSDAASGVTGHVIPVDGGCATL